MIIRQQYLDRIKDYIDNPMIKIISGIRRSGKTEVMKMIISEIKSKGIEDEQIIYINYESFSSRQYRDIEVLYPYILNRSRQIEKKIYIFLDEIQEVSQWETVARSLRIDINCDLYITGSNANMLSKELATLLTGRYIEFRVWPLSFLEFGDFYKGLLNTSTQEELFSTYLRNGGFPDLINIKQKEAVVHNYLASIYDTVVLRDVIERNNIRQPEQLKRIFNYIMDNIGQETSGSKILNYLNSAAGEKMSTTSLYNYIDCLENAMILYSVKPYDLKGKKILKRSEKFFLADLGIRHAVMGYREDDISQMLENIVFLELKRRGYEVYIGKVGDYEVDFIAKRGGITKYYQVAYTIADAATADREYRSLEMIDDNYEKTVLTMDVLDLKGRNGIHWMNIVDFLKDLEA